MSEDIDLLNPLWDKANAAAIREDMPGVLDAWKELADKGAFSIYAKIGSFYEVGRIGVERDTQQALYWYRKAIFECDDPEAHVGLGRLYYQGNGVERDIVKACKHWEKAYAKQSYDAALYLGIAYHHGASVGRDIQLAKKYYHDAAKAEYFYAYGKLSRIAFDEKKYINGIKLLIKGFWLGRRLMKLNPTDVRLLGIE